MIADFSRQTLSSDIASLQGNTKITRIDKSKASMKLFGREMFPHFANG